VDLELIAPAVGGIQASDGARLPADQKVDGGPSVLYDAVAILVSRDEAAQLASIPAARDFVTDAYAHCKFVGYTGDAQPLFDASGLTSLIDGGFISLDDRSAADFLSQCGQLRFWDRQLAPV
jgi:catalase